MSESLSICAGQNSASKYGAPLLPQSKVRERTQDWMLMHIFFPIPKSGHNTQLGCYQQSRTWHFVENKINSKIYLSSQSQCVKCSFQFLYPHLISSTWGQQRPCIVQLVCLIHLGEFVLDALITLIAVIFSSQICLLALAHIDYSSWVPAYCQQNSLTRTQKNIHSQEHSEISILRDSRKPGMGKIVKSFSLKRTPR